MTMPILSRAEMNSDDIIREIGLVKMSAIKIGSFGTFESMCKGKTKYESLERAKRGARRLKGLVPYRCRYCGCWHTGNHLDH